MVVDEHSDQNLDLLSNWICQHKHLKRLLDICDKHHNLKRIIFDFYKYIWKNEETNLDCKRKCKVLISGFPQKFKNTTP